MKNVYLISYLLISCGSVHSQCCSNGINLLANYNPDFSAPFDDVPPGFITANPYTFYPTPGTYIIVPMRDYGACFSTPQGDHTTGDPINGRFLWFDASASASPTTPELAWQPFDPSLPEGTQSLITVSPNTIYVFSCWIRDLAREQDCITGGAPLMGLRINGEEMAEVDLALITNPCCPQWTYLCAEWNSGVNTTALIQIESRRADGWNDLGIDDVYFGTTTEALQFSLGADTAVCEGVTLVVSDNIDNSTNFWSDYSSGDSIQITSPGTYWLEVTKNNCKARDSITVTLDLLPEINLGNDTSICNQIQFLISPTNAGGQISNYIWQNNSTANNLTVNGSGVYWLEASNSCGVSIDSIAVLFFQLIIPIDTIFICPGSTYTLSNGNNVSSPGTYPDTLNVLGYWGCDSIIQRVINWYPTNFDTIQVALCSGASYTSSTGITLSQSGFYSDTLNIQNQFDCDSLRVIEIQILPTVNSIQNINICNGQSYTLPNGTTVTSSGTFLDTLTTTSGCDSIITINLTITPSITVAQNIQLCNGQSYVLPNGTIATSAGTFYDTLTTSSGCDSIITINLNFYNNYLIPIFPEMQLCANDSITFSLPGNFNQIAWSNGQNSNTVIIYQSGNYQVNVSDIYGCVDSANFIVTEILSPNIYLELSDSSICKGDCIKINAVGTNLNEVSWFINNKIYSENLEENDNSILFCFEDTGNYDIRVSVVQECGIAYDTLSINIDEPEAMLPTDTLIQFGDSLNVWSFGNYSEFWWQPEDLLLCDTCESQKIIIIDNQRFTLYYTGSNGCIFTRSFLATINKEGQLYIPTSFTPNGDNVNDEFYAKGTGIIEFNMMVFNRIGELIFESNDINKGWNGTYFQRQVQQDIYAYIIEYKDYSKNVKIERGFVMLLR